MPLFEKHKELIERAIKANHERGYYAAYPEIPKAYPEDALVKGQEQYNNFLNKNFSLLLQNDSGKWEGEEVSPYTQEGLGVKYPVSGVDDLIAKAKIAGASWRKTSPDDRAGLLVESLEKMKAHFFDIAYATQHTTGQSWIMSFQASGPHAADRALEAIAMGYEAQASFPSDVIWEKPMGKFSVRVEKTFSPQPRGIGVVIGCSTFPVWNSLPGLYADLVTGNVAIVKPHSKVILPIAICVAAIQHTLQENGFDPNIVQLAHSTSHAVTKDLLQHPDVKLIDYTGGTSFGDWIESLPSKITFTEKAGVNSVIIDSVKDIDAVMQNLAFSVSLYSGQMCTAPQNFFIPSQVKAGDQVLSGEEVVSKLKDAINALVNNPKMGAGVLGAIQNEKTLERTKQASQLGGTAVLEATAVTNQEFAQARTVSPALLETNASEIRLFENEFFGPIAIAIKTNDTAESVRLAKEMAQQHGALTCAAYSTDDNVMKMIAEEMNEVFVPVTFNFTGPIWVNQHAAFSDFHGTGGNAAGNASFADQSFVVKRFVWIGNRKMI
ncbi:MAG TPA: phenylacetic acid degradation protein PaaN [Chitinophagales bacterium]|nr:phenylacetic acid degradation protein PaaN [Chitinophagales bacterium]